MHVVSKIALVALALVGGAVAGDGESLNPTEQQQLASSTKGGEKEQPGEQVVQDKTETEKKHVTWQHFESGEGHPDNAVCYQIDLHAQAAHEQQKKKTGTDQHTTGHDQSQKKTDQQKVHHDQQTGTQFLEQDGDQQKPGTDQNKEKTGTDQNKVSGDQHTTEENTEKVCWLCHSTTAKEQSAGTSDGTTSQFLELLSGGVTCEDIAKRASAGEHFHCVQTELQETTGVDKLATPSPCKHHHEAVVDQQNKDQQNKDHVEGDGVHKDGVHKDGVHKDGAHKDGAHKDQDVADDDNNEQATEQLPSNN